MASPATPTEVPARHWPTAVALLLILGTGLFVRVYDLHKESIWWDEFTSVMHLEAPEEWRQSPHYKRWNQMVIRAPADSLFDFWVQNRSLDPATMPLYYTLEYLWHHFVWGSVYGLRIFSVILGVVSIPLLYKLGKALFGPWAGLTAALCMALSPIHVHHAQGIRMYVLFTLLAILSAWTFVLVRRGTGKRWWVFHGFVNFVLLWTHPFAILLPVAEGASLLLADRRRRGRVAAWVGLHAVLALPLALYISTVSFWAPGTTEDWLAAPTPVEVFADIFADDMVHATYQLRASETPFAFLPGPAAEMLRGWETGAGLLLVAALAGLMLWFFCRAFYLSNRQDLEEELANRVLPSVFLVCWMLLPAVLLYITSLVYRPCMFPRYTVHSSLAFYLLAGGGVAVLRGTPGRVAAMLLLAGLLLYQNGLLHPGPQRTDWKSAGAYIAENADGDDVVLVKETTWRDVFLYNFEEPPPVPVAGVDHVGNIAAWYLEHCGAPETVVWGVIPHRYFDAGGDALFEEEAEKAGLEYSLEEFGGIKHVLVYRLTRPGPLRLDWSLDWAWAEDYGDPVLSLAEHGRTGCARTLLEDFVQRIPSAKVRYGPLLEALEDGDGLENAIAGLRAEENGFGFFQNLHMDYAYAWFSRAAELLPTSAHAHLQAAITASYLAKIESATEYFAKSLKLNPEYALVEGARLAGPFYYAGGREKLARFLDMITEAVPESARLFVPLRKALEGKGRIEDAMGAVAGVLSGLQQEDRGMPDVAVDTFRKVTEMVPDYVAAHVELGRVMADQGVCHEAMAALNDLIKLDPKAAAAPCGAMAIEFLDQDNPDCAESLITFLLKAIPSERRTFAPLLEALERGGTWKRERDALDALLRGYASKEAKAPAAAVAAFEEAVAHDPDYVAAQAALGAALAERGDCDGTQRALESMLGTDPALAMEPAGRFADALIQADKPDCALAVLRTYAQAAPSDAPVYAPLLDALEEGAGMETALEAVRAMLRGYALAEDNQLEAAVEAFRQALVDAPAYAQARAELGRVYARLGRCESALEAFRALLADDAAHALAPCEDIAATLANGGDMECAARVIEALLEASPADANVFENMLAALKQGEDAAGATAAVSALVEGYGLYTDGRLEEAADAFARAVASDPGLTAAEIELGVVSAELGRRETAAEALARAAGASSDNAMMLNPLVAAMRGEGDLESTLEAVKLVRRAHSLLGEGQYAPALESLREATEVAPQYAYGHLELGLWLFRLERYAEAAAPLQRHTELAPDLGYPWGLLSFVRLIEGDKAGALAAAEQAFSRDPQLEAAYGALIRALVGGDFETAYRERARLQASGAQVPPGLDRILPPREEGAT